MHPRIVPPDIGGGWSRRSLGDIETMKTFHIMFTRGWSNSRLMIAQGFHESYTVETVRNWSGIFLCKMLPGWKLESVELGYD